jgi:hypothetical protein
MAHGGIKEANAFSIAIGPATSMGVEGEMTRVSIASLLEGAGSPAAVDSAGDGGGYLTVGKHGMIADLYSSGSLSSVALDFGLAAPASVDGVVRHDSFDAVPGGGVQAPLAELLQGEAGAGGTSLGFGDEIHVPDGVHALAAGQSVLATVAPALAPADPWAAMGNLDFGRHELPSLFGNDGLPLPISEHHIIA